MTAPQPRVTILYPASPKARFDFDYYVPNHLPLAVGTSLRHAAITCCDADRPVSPGSPYACICVVGFASRGAMDDFRHFFASGHPETRRILNDEPNYTNITPLFVAGMAQLESSPVLARDAIGYRLRLLFRAPSGSRFDHVRFTDFCHGSLEKDLRQHVPLGGIEIDRMSAGVMPDSVPDYHCVWTAWVPDRAALTAFSAFWAGTGGAAARAALAHITDVSAEVLLAEVLTLDMDRAQAVAQQR